MSDNIIHPLDHLPEYAAGMGAPAERDAIARHLADCATCRAELAEWQRTGAATQAAAPQPPPDTRALSTRRAIFAQITQANHTGGILMSSDPSSPGPADADAPSATPAPALRVPGGQRHPAPPARWVAISAMLVIVVGLAAVLAQLSRSGAGSHTTGTLSTTRVGTTSAFGTPPEHGGRKGTCPPEPKITHAIALADLAMVSATEGWAGGGVSTFGMFSQQGVLQHLVNGQWLTDTDLPQAASIDSISMTSPTDGWLTFRGVSPGGINSTTPTPFGLAHYDGQHWHAVPLPDSAIFDSPQSVYRLIVRMASATNGWIMPYQLQPNGPAVFLHDDGTAWQPISAPFSSSLTPPKFYQFYDFAITGPNELWVIGNYTNDTGSGGQDMLIIHYLNGQWSQVPHLGSGSLASIAMLSATDGWIVGQGFAGNQVFLHYDGTEWQQVATPDAFSGANVEVGALTSGPDGTLWGVSINPTTNSNDQIVHLVNGQWQTLPVPNPTTDAYQGFGVGEVIPLVNGDVWALGDIEYQRGCAPALVTGLSQGVILQEHNGQWNATVEPAG